MIGLEEVSGASQPAAEAVSDSASGSASGTWRPDEAEVLVVVRRKALRPSPDVSF